jgi:hypothetical protein
MMKYDDSQQLLGILELKHHIGFRLLEAGHFIVGAVRSTPDDKLCDLQGIGPVAVKHIREVFGPYRPRIEKPQNKDDPMKYDDRCKIKDIIELQVRVCGALMRAGFFSARTVRTASDVKLLQQRGISETMLKHIREVLGPYRPAIKPPCKSDAPPAPTRRDEVALKVLVAMLGFESSPSTDAAYQVYAEHAYFLADCMIEESRKRVKP